MTPRQSPVLIFAIHNTVAWWRCIGAHMGLGAATVVTDLRGEGDVSIVDDFYRTLALVRSGRGEGAALLPDAEVSDVIARCRSLRWLDPQQARSMVLAMAAVLDRLLDQTRPRFVISFPIDRYVKDVLERLCRRRDIQYLELTAAVFTGMSMFLRRGELIRLEEPPEPGTYAACRAELVSPSFVPSYVPRSAQYSKARFLRKMAYFRTRSLAFAAIGRLRRDPLNIHYLDARWFLGHKPRLRDIRMLDWIDRDWEARVRSVPRERTVFFGLQLFPEASIDYWLANPEFVPHEDRLVEAAAAFSRAGFTIVVKDHPLQFGFRQTELIQRLRALDRVILVPYDVPAWNVLNIVGANFTFTGTLGLQTALAGMVSACAPTYYSNGEDFVHFKTAADLVGLADRVAGTTPVDGARLEARRDRIVEPLVRGSFHGDMFSFRGFPAASGEATTIELAQRIGAQISRLSVERGWP